MKNIYTITEQEKNRILGMHQNATKKQYLMEQNTSGAYAMFQGTEKTYKDDSNSNAMFNMVSTYCTRDNLEKGLLPGASNYNNNYELAKNLYYDVMPQYRKGRIIGAALFGTGASPLDNTEKENFPKWIKERLAKIKTMGDLCEVNSILNDKFKVETGLHGIFSSKHPDVNITWNDVMNALKPAFDDGAKRLPNVSQQQPATTPEQPAPEKDEGTPDNKPVVNIAPSLINQIRNTVGSRLGAGSTLNNDDLTAILAKVQALPDKQ